MSEAAVKAAPRTSRMAVTALILGIITFITLLVTFLLVSAASYGTMTYDVLAVLLVLVVPLADLVTLVLSLVAWWRISKHAGQLKGRGQTITGLAFGVVILALVILIYAGGLRFGEHPVCAPPGHSTVGPRPPC
jgi:hypothetical protein